MTTISTHSKPSEIAKWYQNWCKEQVRQFYILERPSPTLKTTWYAEQVVKGNIKASKKNIQACQRHLDDLKRQGTEDFPGFSMKKWPIDRFVILKSFVVHQKLQNSLIFLLITMKCRL